VIGGAADPVRWVARLRRPVTRRLVAKASSAFNREWCARSGTAPLGFDGRSDALLHAYDGQGHRHMEYVRHRGVYRDLPLDAIRRTFADVYGKGVLGAPPD
jgi:hypothetical protein